MYNDDDTRQSDEDYMRSLYLRFRKEVESGQPVEYFEMNELLDIYDYAQDEGDALVQMFVFLTAARLYPSAKDFDERLAFFLSYVSQDAANDMISRQGRKDSALWDVLRMGVKCFPSGNPEPFLKDIISRYDTLDCESALKIIDLLRDMERADLLVKYYPELSKRAEDPRGLGFEIAETVKEHPEHYQAARDIAEELTRNEPFNIEAWLLLARLEFGLEHPDEALAAVDYALAIDPDHFNARLTRGVVMVVMDDHRAEAIALLEAILKENPDNSFALEGLAEAYARDNQKDKAAGIYGMMIERNIPLATGADSLQTIIELETDNLEEYVGKAATQGTDENRWRSIVMNLLDKEKYGLAVRVLDEVYRTAGIKGWVDFYLHTLYDARKLERYAEVFEQAISDPESPASRPGYFALTDYLMLASVYLRLNRREDAAVLCETIEKKKEECNSLDEHFRMRGIKFTARFIHTLATTAELTADLKDFDPMTVDFLP